jgi:hypothetical protein
VQGNTLPMVWGFSPFSSISRMIGGAGGFPCQGFKVLWREFQADLAQRRQPAVARSPLAQVREMGLAHLAEQQMALKGRVE